MFLFIEQDVIFFCHQKDFQDTQTYVWVPVGGHSVRGVRVMGHTPVCPHSRGYRVSASVFNVTLYLNSAEHWGKF